MNTGDSITIQFQSGYDLSATSNVKIWMCLLFMMSCIGSIASSIVIIATLRQKVNASILLLLSLSFADFVYTTQCLIIVIGNLIAGRWAFGKIGAEINYLLTMNAVLNSGMSLSLITIERYIAIFNHTFITKTRAAIWIAITCIFSMLVSLVPIFTGDFEDSLSLKRNRAGNDVLLGTRKNS
ncbi:hypothetical protein HDV04_004896 [Boothiomyces sp. JEL0838]|nr:hypothetical protein HDV04_004896 [Boothiomyces sp. JEL0838]